MWSVRRALLVRKSIPMLAIGAAIVLEARFSYAQPMAHMLLHIFRGISVMSQEALARKCSDDLARGAWFEDGSDETDRFSSLCCPSLMRICST